MAGRKKLPSDAKLEAAIRANRGNLAAVGRQYDCHRVSVWQYIQTRPQLKAAWEDAHEATIDHVEDSLLKRVDEGDTTAMIFYLKTQAKHRGYTEKTETEQSGEMRIVVEYADNAPPRTPPPALGPAADPR